MLSGLINNHRIHHHYRHFLVDCECLLRFLTFLQCFQHSINHKRTHILCVFSIDVDVKTRPTNSKRQSIIEFEHKKNLET